jgi:hypothetical protein
VEREMKREEIDKFKIKLDFLVFFKEKNNIKGERYAA